jgi:aquaporin Z
LGCKLHYSARPTELKGVDYDTDEKGDSGIYRDFLAGFRRLRKRCARGEISRNRNRFFGRIPTADVTPYVIAQLLGAIAGAAVLYVIASGKAGFSVANGFAANGYAEHSPGGYSLLACLVAEVVLTFMFLMIILGVTDRRAPQGFAPLAIGLALTLIHLVSIPVTNASVNPARSTGPSLFVGGWAVSQLWLFWVAPLIGAVLAGLIYPVVSGEAGRVAPERFAEEVPA